MPTLEEMTPDAQEELKEQIKKIEDGIVEKINNYNNQLKEYAIEYDSFRDLESKAYSLSQKLVSAMKSKQQINELEASYTELVDKVNDKRTDVFDVQKNLFTQLQTLYKDHVDYLSQVINGLRLRCEKLEEDGKKSRLDNL